MNTNYTIVLSVDHHEGEKFAAWLNERGHNASVGRDTGNHIDADHDNILTALWNEYCSS
jgi:hypothetical protein